MLLSRAFVLKWAVVVAALLLALLTPLGAQAQSDPPPFFKLPERVLYVGQAEFVSDTSSSQSSASSSSDQASEHPRWATKFQKQADKEPRPLTSRKDRELSARAGAGALSRRNLIEMKAQQDTSSLPSTFASVSRKKQPAVKLDGINVRDAVNSGVGSVYGSTQGIGFSRPSPTVCAGSGHVVHAVAGAIAVYDRSGATEAGPLAMNQFLKLTPLDTVQDDGAEVLGDIVQTPSCVFDAESSRFYLVASWTPGEESSLDRFKQKREGIFGYDGAGIILVVSAKDDPTKPWAVYFIPSTNDGIGSHNDTAPPLNYEGYSSAAEVPLVGVDTYGVYITTNQFGFFSFLGGNIYAIRKTSLFTRRSRFEATRFAIPYKFFSDAFGYSIRPVSPGADTSSEKRGLGVMTFLAIPIGVSNVRSSIGVWVLTNTKSLTGSARKLTLRLLDVPTPDYDSPRSSSTLRDVPQKKGPIPLGKSFGSDSVVARIGYNDEVVHGAAFSQGKVYFTLTSSIGTNPTVGAVVGVINLGEITTRGDSVDLNPTLDKFRIYGVRKAHLLFPAISVNNLQKGILSFSLVGTSYFPTAAYATLSNGTVDDSRIYIAASGKAPLDQVEGYPSTKDSPGRMSFGNWNGATTDEFGEAWGVAEYVSNTRIAERNWATYVFRVDV